MAMRKPLGFLLISFLLISNCDRYECPKSVEANFSLQFDLAGGFAGEHHRLVVYEDGKIETTDRVYLPYGGEPLELMVYDSLTTAEKAAWAGRFNEAGLFCLDDSYHPAERIADGFWYELSVTSGGNAKTITASDWAPPDQPAYFKDLHGLFWELHYELYVPVRDSANVGTLFNWQKYAVKPWPFTEQVPLTDNVYTEYLFSEIDSTGEIARYLNDLYYPDGDYNKDIHYLHLEGDYLYRFTMIDNGFKVNSAHPVQYWPQELNIHLSDITDEGVVVHNEVFRQVAALFIEPLYVNSIFVMSLNTEVVSAYYLRLVNGEAVD